MSREIRRSIRGSYGPKQGARLVQLLDAELAARGLPCCPDPEPEEKSLRGLPCGNAGAVTYFSLTKLAESARLPWTLGRWRSASQIALPFDFPEPLRITVGRTLFVFREVQEVASISAILNEIVAIAPVLGIPLENGALSDSMRDRLAENDAVSDLEPPGLFEDERALWLDLYCAARYCLEDTTPMIII